MILTLQIVIFGIFIFMLFFVLWERGEREEGGVRGASYEEVLSDYARMYAEHEKESNLKVALEGKVSRYYSLAEITSRAGSLLQEDELYDFIVTRTFQIIGYGKCSIMTLSKKGDLVVEAVSGFSEKDSQRSPHAGDPVYQWVIEKKRPLLITNFSLDPRFSSFPDKEEGSLICVPIMKKGEGASTGEISGIMEVRSPIPDAFKEDDLRLLSVLSDILMLSLENIRLYQKTQELSIRDGLTHLYLHRYFQERLEEEMKRCSFYKLKTSLLMCDLDFFKKCNDTYGHIFGDSVLKEVSEILLASVRDIDFVARYGGDEFAIILPETSIEGARVVAERIRTSVAEHTFHTDDHEMHITISIGIGSYPGEGIATKEDLIAMADGALLQAKNTGRNKVC